MFQILRNNWKKYFKIDVLYREISFFYPLTLYLYDFWTEIAASIGTHRKRIYLFYSGPIVK